MGLDRLRTLARRLYDARALVELVSWDQQTYMPPRGQEARARHMALLAGWAHELLVSEELGSELQAAETEASGESALWIARLRRDRERALRVPRQLVERLAEVTARGHRAWLDARSAEDFGRFEPVLREILDLKRQEAEALGPPDGGELYDALLEEYEPGMRVRELDTLVEEVVQASKRVLQEVAVSQEEGPEVPGPFPLPGQEALCRFVLERMGFDFEGGRLDVSPHPFTTGLDIGDVRLTVRYREEDFRPALYAAMHEGGHGLYEQGLDPQWGGTPLAEAASLGVHESQSRFWENQVGRSRAFLAFLLPELERRFGDALGGVDLEGLWRHVNRVAPTLIRVEADEVTYNLHIALRYDLERRLLSGGLDVADLPEAWRGGMEELLGIRPGRPSEGELQDVHWSMGLVGYFPTYLLGNLYAAQFAEALVEEVPDWEARASAGDFEGLLSWLREKIHRQGRRFEPPELVRYVTGEPVSAAAFRRYLEAKYLGER